MIWRLIKWGVILGIAGLAVVVGYAVLGDFSAPAVKTEQAVTINVD